MTPEDGPGMTPVDESEMTPVDDPGMTPVGDSGMTQGPGIVILVLQRCPVSFHHDAIWKSSS